MGITMKLGRLFLKDSLFLWLGIFAGNQQKPRLRPGQEAAETPMGLSFSGDFDVVNGDSQKSDMSIAGQHTSLT